MLKAYLKSAFRNLWKYKAYSIINTTGLSIGLASSFIIMLFSINELSYDRHHENLDRIYVATTELVDYKWTQASVPFPLGPALKSEYPDIQEFARFLRSMSSVKYKDKTFQNTLSVSADPSIFRILTLPLVSGTTESPVSERDRAVISGEMAQKIFGSADPLGEIITVNWRGEPYNLKVSAVMKDNPKTSTMRADIIVPLSIAERWLTTLWGKIEKSSLESWNLQIIPTYILLAPTSSPDQLENKMTSFGKAHTDPNQRFQFHLFPLKDLYFHSSAFINNSFPSGDSTNVTIYSTIAVLTLLIACINFVILSTGRATVRTKEIAVRKVIGATRFDLMKQIMTESLTVSMLSLPIALLLVQLFLPSLSQLLGKRLPENQFHNAGYLLLFSGITLLVGFLSGSYVSFYLSGFRPMDILRNKLGSGAAKATLRKIMIGVQMVIFIGLITASITIYKQVRFFHSKDMGFDKENLVVLSSENRGLGSTLEAFKTELKREPSILGVSGAFLFPGSEGGGYSTVPDKLDPSRKISYQGLSVDRDFIETMRMQMVDGKSFAEAAPDEANHAVILNEAAVKAFGINDPGREMFQSQRILGVIRDFHMHSLREPISPIVLNCNTQYLGEVAVRVRRSADVPRIVSFVQTTSKAFNNGKPMDLQFFDERLDDLYGLDYRFARMIGYFTALAIFIACLGLFGVSLFVIQMRVKEIGIRKVMGASVGTVFYLVAKEFLLLSATSTLVAVPITIYLIDGWLQNYAYRVTVDIVVVFFALLAAMVIVLVTIGYQALRAATANPVEALRYE